MNRSRGTSAWLTAALLVCTLLLSALPASADEPKAAGQPAVAVVETDKELGPLAALLTAQLSQEGVRLVERKQLDAVLQEQALSAAGLTDRATLVKVGQLVRADAFVLLSLQKGGARGAPALLRVRVAETGHGVRLMDALEAWDPRKADAAAGALAGRLHGVVDRLRLPPGQAIAVGIVDVRNALPFGNRYQWLADGLKGALSARMSAEPRVVVLEREDLDLLLQEKELTAGEHGAFWGSAVLMTGALLPASAGEGLELEVGLRAANDVVRGTAKVPVSPEDPAQAVQAVAEQLVPKLTSAAASGTWQPEQEAEKYYLMGISLVRNGLLEDGMPLLATAHALAPRNALYAVEVHSFALGSHLVGGGIKAASDELAALEMLLGPSIDAGDVGTLLTCMPALGGLPFPPDKCDDELELAGRWYRLNKRVEDVLKAHPDNPAATRSIPAIEWGVTAMLDTFRTRLVELQRSRDALLKAGRQAEAEPLQRLIDRYREVLEPLRAAPAQVNVRVRMLLKASEWPMPWEPGSGDLPQVRVLCENGLIWMAMTGHPRNTLGLAGLDPKAQEPVGLWQAAGGIPRLDMLNGLVLGEEHCYVASGSAGLIEMPGTRVRGVGVVEKPRLLTDKDGLPTLPVTGIAGQPERMWVGFSSGRMIGGLGLYDARTGKWKTFLSNVGQDENHPAANALSYRVTEMMPVGKKILFCGWAGPLGLAGRDGLWEFDPESGGVRQLLQINDLFFSTAADDECWLRSPTTLLHIEPLRKALGLAVREAPMLPVKLKADDWTFADNAFCPGDAERRLGRWAEGRIDLTTAAIHGDQLWVRCGKTQIAILQRGQKLEDAKKINNDILDGGPVLQFFETPYGLLAVGQGSAGLVEPGR